MLPLNVSDAPAAMRLVTRRVSDLLGLARPLTASPRFQHDRDDGGAKPAAVCRPAA